ncbi:MAG: hypothetical protein WCB57_15835 [Pseudonocardiaceae bacterium]
MRWGPASSTPSTSPRSRRACHANGERVEHHGQLLEALRRALKSVESGTSAIVDVAIHQN